MISRPKLVIGKLKCPCCAKVGTVTLTAKGGGYFMCRNMLADDVFCGVRVNIAKASARKMFGDKMDQLTPKVLPISGDKIAAANINAPPSANENSAPEVKKEGGNFLGY